MSFLDALRKKNAPPKGEQILAKACPFCGGLELLHWHDRRNKLHYFGCHPCMIFAAAQKQAEAVAKWNNRFGELEL